MASRLSIFFCCARTERVQVRRSMVNRGFRVSYDLIFKMEDLRFPLEGNFYFFLSQYDFKKLLQLF